MSGTTSLREENPLSGDVSMKNAETFVLCPTDGGLWYRLYSVYEVSGVPHVCFVGHLPRALEAIANQSGKDLDSQRYPKLSSVVRDLRGIQAAMNFAGQEERTISAEVIADRPGRRNLRVCVNGETIAWLKIRQKLATNGHGLLAKRVSHLCGPLDALLHASSEQSPETDGQSTAIPSEIADDADFGSLKLWRFELYGREEWSRLWATFTVGTQKIVTFLGHYPDPSYMRSCPQARKGFASQRPPRTSAIASDIVTIAMKTRSTHGDADLTISNVQEENEHRTRTRLRALAGSGKVLGRLQFVSSVHSDGEIKSVIQGGIMGPLGAMLRIIDGLAIKQVRLNRVTGFGLHAI